jgi:hypothetical protein
MWPLTGSPGYEHRGLPETNETTHPAQNSLSLPKKNNQCACYGLEIADFARPQHAANGPFVFWGCAAVLLSAYGKTNDSWLAQKVHCKTWIFDICRNIRMKNEIFLLVADLSLFQFFFANHET